MCLVITLIQFSLTSIYDYANSCTSHFSGYMVTTEAINCCAQRAYVLFFGFLQNQSEKEPLATVSVHFATTINSTKEYESVSKVLYSHF